MEKSAGILAYRIVDGKVQVLLGETGGPFWKKGQRKYGIPKGMVEEGETEEQTARREFTEETGFSIPEDCELIDLGTSKSFSGKEVRIFAVKIDFAPGEKDVPIRSMSFPIEWPPKSGKIETFPELDSASYFTIAEGEEKIFQYQKVFLQRVNYLSDI